MSTVSRGKRLVARRGTVVAVVLAAVGLLALGGAGWLLANPPTDTVTQQRGAQTFATGAEPSAGATAPNGRVRSRSRSRPTRSSAPTAAASGNCWRTSFATVSNTPART